MHRAIAAFLVAAAILSSPAVGGQGAEGAPSQLRISEDVAGDNVVRVGDQATPASRWAASDLVFLDASESGRAYVFWLGVQAIGSEDTLLDSIAYVIHFSARDQAYDLRIYYDAEQRTARGSLYKAGGDFGFGTFLEDLVILVDTAAGTYEAHLPHTTVVGLDGAPLVRGDTIGGFWVEAESAGGQLLGAGGEGTVDTADRMPDADVAAPVWSVVHGSPQSGSLRATSKAPVRISNGEATTFLYEVDVKNLADHADVVEASASGAPDNWVVTFPQDEVRLDGQTVVTVPVLVTTPFFHDHGVLVMFNVTFQSRSDPLSYAVVDLGVRYTQIAQPAGHHNTIYLHDAANFQYVNTFEEPEIPPEEGGGRSFSGGCSAGSSSGNAMTDLIPLVPGLDIGINVDMDQVGEANLILATQAPVMETFSVGGFVVVWYGEDRPNTCLTAPSDETIAVIERSAPITIEADSMVTVPLAITPMPYGDYLPYANDIHMAIVLVVWEEGPAHAPFCCLGLEAPTFEEGSEFRLPLAEYHDPVNTHFTTLSGVDLTSLTAQQRLVNPGETAVFELELENIGVAAASFDLEVTGTRLEWVTVLGDARVRLEPGEVRQLAVAVTPPADAEDEELVDVTLHAVKTDDANIRSLIRLLAEVDTDEDHPDDKTKADDLADSLTSKKAPGPTVGIFVAALASLAFLRRRRDD